MSVLVVVVAIIVIALAYLIVTYNGLVRARNAYRNGFAQIGVQLTRRHDLIPNLVETAKAYLAHERETLEAVIAARTRAAADLTAATKRPEDPHAIDELGKSENFLTQTLQRLFALSEAYPNLKANENMAQLAEEIASTENRVAFARQAFNDSVMTYNNRREVFPASLVSPAFGFMPAHPLEMADPEIAEVPRVAMA